MRYSSIISAGLMATSAMATPLIETRDVYGGKKVVAYWGNVAGNIPLDQMCSNPDVDTIILSFLVKYPTQTPRKPGVLNFGNACGNQFPSGLLNCNQMATQLQVCSQNKKEVLLSIGGSTMTDPSFADATHASYTADWLWKTFGKNPPASQERPLGSFLIDGIDLDIEHGGQSAQALYPGFINSLRSKSSNGWKISAAPQCVRPDANMGNYLQSSWFDYIFVQLYNTQQCSARNEYNNPNSATNTFDDWLDATYKNSNCKVFLGLPASTAASSSPSYYLTPDEAKTVIEKYSRRSKFGGVMMWDGTYDANNQICSKPYSHWIKEALGMCSRFETGPVVPNPCPAPSSSSSVRSSTSSTVSSRSSSTVSTTSSAVVSPRPSSPSSSSSSVVASPTLSSRSSSSSSVSRPSSSPSSSSSRPTSSATSSPSSRPTSSPTSSPSSRPTSSPTSSPSSRAPSSSPSSTKSSSVLVGPTVTSRTSSVTPSTISRTSSFPTLSFSHGPFLNSTFTRTTSAPGGGNPGGPGNGGAQPTSSVPGGGNPGGPGAGGSPSSSVPYGGDNSPSSSVPYGNGGYGGHGFHGNPAHSNGGNGGKGGHGKPTATKTQTSTYVDVCPTGLTTKTATYTRTCYEGDDDSDSSWTKTYVPKDWTVTVTVCTACPGKPTVTVTKPCDTPAWNPAKPTGDADSGSWGKPGKATSTMVVVVTPVPVAEYSAYINKPKESAVAAPVGGAKPSYAAGADSGSKPSYGSSAGSSAVAKPVSGSPSKAADSFTPSGTKGSYAPQFTGAASRTNVGMTIFAGAVMAILAAF